MVGIPGSWLMILLAVFALASESLAEDHVPQPGKFSPPNSGKYLAGELVVIDPIPLTGAGAAVLDKSTGFALQASGTWTVLVYLDGVPVEQHDVFVAA